MLDLLKKNLVVEGALGDRDDDLLREKLASAVEHAETYQHLHRGYYISHPMSPATMHAVIMLASYLYESRDGSTGGFFADSPAAAESVWTAVNRLLDSGKEWII